MEATVCKATLKFHNDVAVKIYGKDKKRGLGGREISLVEGRVEGGLREGGERLRGIGYSEEDIALATEVMGVIEREGYEGIEKRDGMVDKYVKMVDKYIEKSGKASKGRYNTKRLTISGMRAVLYGLGGKRRSEAMQSIGKRFSAKVTELQMKSIGLKREDIINGRGRDYGWWNVFDEVKRDMEDEAAAVTMLLDEYKAWRAGAEGDHARNISNLEAKFPRMRNIGMYWNDMGDIVNFNIGDERTVEAKIAGLEEAKDYYTQVLGAWETVCLLALNNVAGYEGVKIRPGRGVVTLRKEFVEDKEDEIGNIGMREGEEDEETKPDNITNNHSEFMAAWKSVPDEMRSLLANVQQLDANGRPRFGISGEPLCVNPQGAYQQLILMCRTAFSSSDLKEMLNWIKAISPNYAEFVDKIVNDEQLLTTLFVALRKGFQLYTQTQVKQVGFGVMELVQQVLNGRLGKRKSTFENRRERKKVAYKEMLKPYTFADERVNQDFASQDIVTGYNWQDGINHKGYRLTEEDIKTGEQLYNVANYWFLPDEVELNVLDNDKKIVGTEIKKTMPVIEMTYEEAVSNGKCHPDWPKLFWDQRRYNVLISTANALGIRMTPDNVAVFLSGSAMGTKLLRDYSEGFRDFAYNYYDSRLTGEKLFEENQIVKTGDPNVSDEEWKSMHPKGVGYVPAYFHIDKRSAVALTKIDNSLKSSDLSFAGYSLHALAPSGHDNKRQMYESAIPPSFLSDFIDKVNTLPIVSDKRETLSKYLDSMYLKDEKYMKDGFIPNVWLRTLYNEASYLVKYRGRQGDASQKLCEKLGFTRDLGTSEKAFENISDKEYLSQMISVFFNDERYGRGALNSRKVRFVTPDEFNDLFMSGRLYKDTRYIVRGFLTKRQTEMGEIDLFSKEIPATERDENGNYQFADGYIPTVTVSWNPRKGLVYDAVQVPMGTYSMFVQGDSGASRYITAPRYAVGDVVDEMVNLVKGERNRMKQVKDLRAAGYEIDNYSKDHKDSKKDDWNEWRFTMFPYVNDYILDKLGLKGADVDEINSRQEEIRAEVANLSDEVIHELVQNHMEDSFAGFLADCDEMGLFEKTGGSYKYMQTLIGNNKGDNGIDFGDNRYEDVTDQEVLIRILKDFYYNHTLAQQCMSQIFDGDVSMFVSVEDMVKRHKQVVANGEALDMAATYNGESSAALRDTMERSVYVEDIAANSEIYDPDFMESVFLNTVAEVNPNELENAKKAVADGLCKYVIPKITAAMSNEEIQQAEKEALAANNERWRILQDYMRSAEGIEYFELRYKPYTKSTLTDGQAWRCLTSYRSIQIRRGTKWWTPDDQRAYETIQQIRRDAKQRSDKKLTTEEILQIQNLMARFTPLKPFSYGFEEINYKDGEDEFGQPIYKTAKIASQHKCSDCVVIPELLPEGSKLRQMADIMEQSFEDADNDQTGNTHKLDVIYSTECVKVGIYKPFSLKGSVEEVGNRLKEAIQTQVGVHAIPWQYYRVQTNVPDHLNEERGMGTQLMKIGMSNLDFSPNADYRRYFADYKDKDGNAIKRINLGKDEMGNDRWFDLGTSKMNALILNDIYQSQFVCNIMEALAEFESRLSTLEDISDEVINTLRNNLRADIDKIYGFMMTGDEEFIMPLFEPTVEHDTAGALLSIFRNSVNKIMVKGGSAVQQSPFGLTQASKEFTRAEYDNADCGDLHVKVVDNNILDVECEIAFNETYTDAYGRTVKLDYKTYVNADGTLKTDADGNTLIEQDYPGILDIIAYRIPTERCYSAIRLHVKRFTPAVNGATIKVPQMFTRIAGFDFDIDKLYLLRKEFKEIKTEWESIDLTKEQRARIVDQIEKDHPEFIKDIAPVTEEAFGSTQLWDIFGVIYGDNPDFEGDYRIKSALKAARTEGDKTPLNQFWEDSPEIARMAKKRGFENAKDYKQYLVEDAAEKLGFIPERLITIKDGYKTMDADAIEAAGMTKWQVFKEAADKLGIALRKPKPGERFQQYDFDKSPVEQSSRAVRNNLVLDILRQRLGDKESFFARTIPGGFETAEYYAPMMRYLTILAPPDADVDSAYKDAKAQKMVPLTSDFSDPLSIVQFNKQNQVAAKLIGMFANESTNNIFSQLLDRFDLIKTPEKDCGLYMFGGGVTGSSKGRSLVHHNDPLIANLVDKSMAEDLAASVDAVKNPVLNFYNLNTTTANAAALMQRTGFTWEEVGLFMNQPIIQELCDIVDRQGVGIDRAVAILERKYFDGRPCVKETNPNLINVRDCAKDILSYKKAKEIDRANFVSKFKSEGAFATRTAKQNNANVVQNAQMNYNIGSRRGRFAMAQRPQSQPNLMPEQNQKREEHKELTVVERMMAGNSDFVVRQKAVLAAFKDMAESGQQLSRWITTTKFTATNTVGSTPGAVYSKLQSLEKDNNPTNFDITFYSLVEDGSIPKGATISFNAKMYDKRSINDTLSVRKENGELKTEQELKEDRERYLAWCQHTPFMMEQAMYNALRFGVQKVLGKVMPYETRPFQKLLQLAANVSAGGKLSADTIDMLFRDRILWELCQYGVFNGDLVVKRKIKIWGEDRIIAQREYWDKYFIDKSPSGAYEGDYFDFLDKYKDLVYKYKLFDEGIIPYEYELDKTSSAYYNTTKALGLQLSEAAGNQEYRAELQSEILDILEHYQQGENEENYEFYKEAMDVLVNILGMSVDRYGLDYSAKNVMYLMPTEFLANLIMVTGDENDNSEKKDIKYPQVLQKMMNDKEGKDDDIARDTIRFLLGAVVNNMDNCYSFIANVNVDSESNEVSPFNGELGLQQLRLSEKGADAVVRNKVKNGTRTLYALPLVIKVTETKKNGEQKIKNEYCYVMDVDNEGFTSTDLLFDSPQSVQYKLINIKGRIGKSKKRYSRENIYVPGRENINTFYQVTKTEKEKAMETSTSAAVNFFDVGTETPAPVQDAEAEETKTELDEGLPKETNAEDVNEHSEAPIVQEQNASEKTELRKSQDDVNAGIKAMNASNEAEKAEGVKNADEAEVNDALDGIAKSTDDTVLRDETGETIC